MVTFAPLNSYPVEGLKRVYALWLHLHLRKTRKFSSSTQLPLLGMRNENVMETKPECPSAYEKAAANEAYSKSPGTRQVIIDNFQDWLAVFLFLQNLSYRVFISAGVTTGMQLETFTRLLDLGSGPNIINSSPLSPSWCVNVKPRRDHRLRTATR